MFSFFGLIFLYERYVLAVGEGQLFGTTHNICSEASLQITKEELRRRIGQNIHARI